MTSCIYILFSPDYYQAQKKPNCNVSLCPLRKFTARHNKIDYLPSHVSFIDWKVKLAAIVILMNCNDCWDGIPLSQIKLSFIV